MSRRIASNMRPLPTEIIVRGRAKPGGRDVGGVPAVRGQPLQRRLDLLGREAAELVDGAPAAELARDARRRDRRAAAVRLEAHLPRVRAGRAVEVRFQTYGCGTPPPPARRGRGGR